MPEAITHRRVLAIALPIVLSNATVPLLGLVDTGVVGQLGPPEPIAAVGLGAVVLGALYWVFGFLRMGITGLTAQAIGRGDDDESARLLLRGLLVAGVGGLGLIVLQLPLFWGALAMSKPSPEVAELTRSYMCVRIWAAPAPIGLYAITGWLIAAERTRAVLLLQLWTNGVNMGLDLLFVFGLGAGVEGVAWATVIAELTGLGLGLWLCRAALARAWQNSWAAIFDRSSLLHMTVVNSDIMIRSLLLQAIFLSFVFLGSRMSTLHLAANQILLHFLEVTAYGLDGFALAAETLVGQAHGARNRAKLRRAAVVTSLWGAAISVVLSVVFLVAGASIIDLIAKDPGVRAAAREFLPYMAAAPVLGVASWMLDGIFIGATRARDMRNMMALSTGVYAVSVVALLPLLGNHGLWIALLISFVARGVMLGLRYPALEASST